jgi:methionyl-tRNA formyltransferase
MPMRIIFFGTTDFSVSMLDSLIENGHEVAAVVTLPDRPGARGHKLIPTCVKKFALSRGLNIIEAANLKDGGFAQDLRNLKADLGVVVSFKILPRAVYTAPRLGTVNVHPSLLPSLRGAAPVRWALIRGLSMTGVTTFLLDDKVDTGDLLLSEKIDIDRDENCDELFKKIEAVGADLLRRTIEQLEAGTTKPIRQDNSLATPAPKLNTDICRIDWTQPAISVHNLVRALSPSPGAWTTLENERFKILKARPIEADGIPGEVVLCDPRRGLVVACGEGGIEVLKVQAFGKRPLETCAFICGCNEQLTGKVFL